MNTTKYKRTTIRSFMEATSTARTMNSLIADNLSEYKYEDLEGIELYLANDNLSGFGVFTNTGELVNVFSLVKGRGPAMVKLAVLMGAKCLDCFEGYLVDFYSEHGFITYQVEPNWTEGGPSVHYMRLTK